MAEYEALLMSAAVQQDEGGVVFDSTAAGWKELVSRCEQADRDNAKRRKERPQHSTTQLGAASSARSASPAAALSAASVSSVPVASSIAPSAATSLFSKLSAAIATKASTEHGGEERETKEDGAANGENARKQLSARGRPAAAPRARRGSQPTAAPPPSAQPAMAQPVESAESDTQHNRRTKRATAAATLPSAIHVGGNEPPAAVPAAATGETESAALSASPSHSDSRRLRSVRMLHSAAHRTNADRIKRSANKHVRDAQQMQADLAFEQRLTDEVDDKYSDEQLSEEWKERRQRDNEREAERKRREDEDERLRIAAGGRKKRKLVIPTAAQIRHPQSGEPIDELDYMQVLLQQLNEPDDSRVDWWLAGQLAIVTGLPHQHRMRVWSVMLKQRIAASEQQQQQQQQGEGDELEAAISVLQQSAEDTHEASVLSPGSDSSSLPSSSLPSPKLDLINQRTVRVDIDRTLPHFVRMQRQDVKHDMEVILTAYDTNTTEPWRYRTLSQSAQPDQPAHSAASAPCVVDAVLRYCKRHRLTYKQGMNYLLAPFFFLVSPPLSSSSRRSVLSLYASFIGTFVPNTFADDEFGSLQCVFLLFRHLLLYHDPQLCAHLDANEMGPELYASSWFITLYANRCKMEVVLYLWDIMLLEAAHDPMLHYFVSLALLIANRAAILKEPNVSLPEQLTKLTIGNKKDAHTLVQRAKQLYRHNTSRSIRDKLRHITHAKISIDSPAYTELQQWQALHVSAEEVVQHIVQRGVAKADSAGSSAQKDDTATEPSTTGDLAEPKFFVLDCRPLSQYNSGHLPMSFHLDPDLLEERRAEELERRLDALMGMRGCHLCFADAAVDDEPLDSSNEPSSINSGSNNGNNAPSPQLAFLSLLLRRNFKYLSIISGGFAACHARILSLDRSSELVDHRPDECLECNGRRFSRKEKKSLFNSMSAGMKRLGMGMIARLDQQQSSASTSASAALAADGAAGGSSSLYYNLSAEHKADNVPDGVVVLPATHQLKLLLTVRSLPATGSSCSHITQPCPAAFTQSSRVCVVWLCRAFGIATVTMQCSPVLWLASALFCSELRLSGWRW